MRRRSHCFVSKSPQFVLNSLPPSFSSSQPLLVCPLSLMLLASLRVGPPHSCCPLRGSPLPSSLLVDLVQSPPSIVRAFSLSRSASRVPLLPLRVPPYSSWSVVPLSRRDLALPPLISPLAHTRPCSRSRAPSLIRVLSLPFNFSSLPLDSRCSARRRWARCRSRSQSAAAASPSPAGPPRRAPSLCERIPQRK